MSYPFSRGDLYHRERPVHYPYADVAPVLPHRRMSPPRHQLFGHGVRDDAPPLSRCYPAEPYAPYDGDYQDYYLTRGPHRRAAPPHYRPSAPVPEYWEHDAHREAAWSRHHEQAERAARLAERLEYERLEAEADARAAERLRWAEQLEREQLEYERRQAETQRAARRAAAVEHEQRVIAEYLAAKSKQRLAQEQAELKRKQCERDEAAKRQLIEQLFLRHRENAEDVRRKEIEHELRQAIQRQARKDTIATPAACPARRLEHRTRGADQPTVRLVHFNHPATQEVEHQKQPQLNSNPFALFRQQAEAQSQRTVATLARSAAPSPQPAPTTAPAASEEAQNDLATAFADMLSQLTGLQVKPAGAAQQKEPAAQKPAASASPPAPAAAAKPAQSQPEKTDTSSDELPKFLQYVLEMAKNDGHPSEGPSSCCRAAGPTTPAKVDKGKGVAHGEKNPRPAAAPAAAAEAKPRAQPDAQPKPALPADSITKLRSIAHEFGLARDSFTFPDRLVFGPSSSDPQHPPALVFNKTNSSYHAQTNKLLQLILAADDVTSDGDQQVRQERKALVKQLEKEIELLEQKRDKLWETVKVQRENGEEHVELESVSSGSSVVDHAEHAEMIEENNKHEATGSDDELVESVKVEHSDAPAPAAAEVADVESGAAGSAQPKPTPEADPVDAAAEAKPEQSPSAAAESTGSIEPAPKAVDTSEGSSPIDVAPAAEEQREDQHPVAEEPKKEEAADTTPATSEGSPKNDAALKAKVEDDTNEDGYEVL